MSEPVSPTTAPVRRPFADRPRRVTGSAWLKPVAIGCGLLLLLLFAGGVLIVLNLDTMFRWALETQRDQVVANLTEDLAAGERARLDAAFDGAAAAVTGGRVDQAELLEVQAEVARLVRRPPRSLTMDDLEPLLVALERLAGGTSDGGESDLEAEDRDGEPAGTGDGR